jgi:2-oxoglutarate dehydrogenase E1 component
VANDPSDSLLSGENLPFLEDLYAQYLEDADSVDESWRTFFEEHFDNGLKGRAQPSFSPRSIFSPIAISGGNGAHQFSEARYEEFTNALHATSVKTPGKSTKFAARVRAMVRAYRLHGHLDAMIDPLERKRPEPPPELDPATYGISSDDMDTPVQCEDLFGNEQVTLRRVVERLRELYCHHVGVEFQNIPDSEPRFWLRKQIERNNYAPIDGADERKRILEGLIEADAFEEFLDKKYIGAKRFSVSGGDSLIPMMRAMLDEGGSLGVESMVLGMAHRGRLNVLRNIMGKPAAAMLAEFEKAPNPEDYLGSSDVKYHMGYSNDYETPSGQKIHLSLAFNPSHLEFVNPVVLGRARAKQDRMEQDDASTKLVPLLLHGDAAFAGQGIVAETLNMSQIPGYDVGGTIHIVINNQVGFTAIPEETRSTTYATDIAKILEVPIFHVNGQDPEACARVAKLAMRYRQRFQQDVVIDLVCFRKYGHNEGDEPRFTQPEMYSIINNLEAPRVHYAKELIDSGVISKEDADAMWDDHYGSYSSAFETVKADPKRADINTGEGVWNKYRGGNVDPEPVDTSVPLDRLEEIGEVLSTIPDDVKAHRTIKRLFKTRAQMAAGEEKLDWGMAESLAFGTLLADGTPIRLTGQDSVRGTFSHRHAAVTDNENGEKFWPARQIPGAARYEVYNSLLSEAGVLGFEHGYSLDYPDALVGWEAQFGDFSNGAQVIIDQFISSSEDKWKRLSGLVMLLPHGYEGQGPEHSSARLERYLQLCAEDNMFVCNITTPANYFHALRRQVLDPVRKPLIVMTPKSLLRLREATSDLSELAEGRFQHVITETRDNVDPGDVTRVLLCSGKVYYDLLGYASENQVAETAILRLEQLYPFHGDKVKAVVDQFPNVNDIVWVQEEPKNMGAWNFLFPHLVELFGVDPLPRYVGRVASASPATGSKESHDLEQTRLVEEAFADL